jgi:hypothetical protein
MIKRHWITAVALGLTCVLLAAVLFAYQRPPYYPSADDAAEKGRYSREVGSEACPSSLSPEELASCVKHEIASRGQEDRERQDLRAQQYMAQYTYWLLLSSVVLSVLGLAINAIGVVLLLGSLREARRVSRSAIFANRISFKASRTAENLAQRANELAARQFEAGLKPWVIPQLVGDFLDNPDKLIDFKEAETRQVFVHTRLKLENVGELPAMIERCSVELVDDGSWMELLESPPDDRATPKSFLHDLRRGESVYIDPHIGAFVDPAITHSIGLGVIKVDIAGKRKLVRSPPAIRGEIEYSSPIGVRYRHHFQYRMSNVYGGYVRDGGPDANREEKIQ